MAENGGKHKSKGLLARARPEWSRRSLASGSNNSPLPATATATAPPATTTNHSSASLNSATQQQQQRPTDTLLPRSTYSSNISNQPSTTGHFHQPAHPSTSSHLAPTPTNSNTVSQGSLAATLVKRVVARLPIHSGSSTSVPDQDESVAQACSSLETFARTRLAMVLLPLLAEIDALTKPPFHSDSDFVSLDLLRSQLFLLALLSRCLFSHWRAHDLSRRSTTTTSNNPPATTDFLDPPPLEDALARQLLAVAVGLLKVHVVQDDELSPLNASVARETGLSGPNTSVSFLAQSLLRSRTSPSPSSHPRTRPQASALLVRHAGEVIHFLSASNWNVVMGRIKARVLHPAPGAGGAGVGAGGEEPDLSEMRVLECCCLDRRRLGGVIQELCNTFIHLRRPTQASLSILLHRSLWSFLESHPHQYTALTTSLRRLEGGPEVLFDIIYTLSEASKRKDYAWPVMTMLLVVCPDLVGKLVVGEGARSPGLTKKVQFLDGLRKALKGKLIDVSITCYADLARAASYTEPDDHDPSALRLLVADFEMELKNTLFDPHHPFLLPVSSGSTSLGTSLTTQTLLSLYRLNPSNVIESVFAPLLRPEAHEKQKAAVLEAMLLLFTEGAIVPWSPGPLALLSTVAKPLRGMFLELATHPTPPTRRPSSSRQQTHLSTRSSHEHPPTSHLLLHILHLWSHDLRFLVHGVFRPPLDAPANQPGSGDTLARVWVGVVGILEDGAHEVRRAAMELVGRLLEEEGEEVASARDGAGLEVATLPVSWAICRFVVEASSAEEQMAVEVLLKDLKRYQQLFSRQPSPQFLSLLSQTPSWTSYFHALEIALLTSLTSSSAHVRSLAIQSIIHASAILDAFDRLGVAIEGSTAIKELAAGFAKVGGKASGKEVRKMLGQVERGSVGTVAAWDEAMRRWRELSGVIFARGEEEDEAESGGGGGHRRESSESSRSPEQHFEEWINLSGLLLASSGVCVDAAGIPPLEEVVSKAAYPSRFFRRVDRAKQVDRLIQELVDFLVSDSINVRDSVRDLLGHDLSSLQFPSFVAHLDQISRHFFSQDNGIPVTEEAFTVFIEQTIAVLRLVFDRERSTPPPALSDTAVTTLDGLLLSFTIYVQRLESSLQAYRLKIRLCSLCEVILAQREPRQRDSTFRNKILERFVSWASDAPSARDEGHERLQRDLDLACLKAMVPLLDGLVIHSTDSTDGSSAWGTDPRLFNRYFDFFAFSLHRLVQSQSDVVANGYSKPSRSEAKVSLNTQSRDAVVSALANLLSANVETAQLQFGEMSLSADVDARAAYLETLTKVVDKGTRFDQLKRPVEDDTFAQLVQLLRQPGPLAIALCHVASAAQFEDLIEIFLKVFNSRQVVARFLKAVIEMEVALTDHESTLFRGNSFATRILTVYARARGYHYLRSTLKDLLLTLCQKPPEFSMDFDPHRQTAHDDVASRNLEQVTEAFLVCISQSIDQVPPAIRDICAHIGDVVGERFPESVFTAIGGFIFLRFINPAIVSPENIDLDLPAHGSAGDNRDIRRGLVMITKVLQALANNVRFGSKEPGMKKLNEFMDVQVFVMTRFLQAISHYSPAEEPSEPQPNDEAPDSTLDEADRSFLHQFLSDNAEKLGVELLQGKHTGRHWQEGSAPSAAVGQETWSQVTDLIAALGTPPEAAARAAAAEWDVSPAQAYASFMARNELRTEGSVWDRLFYEISGNKSGNTTFCLLLHRIKAETADLESLVYYIFKALEKVDGPWEVLIDATRFAKANEVPPVWVAQLVSIIPASTSQQLVRIVLFSANSVLRRYVRKLARSMSFENLDTRRVLAISTTTELEQHFEDVEMILPISTISLGREKRTLFSQVTERHQVKVENPVVFKIGQRTLVLSTAKRQELFSDVRVVLDDIVELSDIEEVRKQSVGVEGDGMILKVAGEEHSRRFLVNVRRDELFTALNEARSDAPAGPSTIHRDRSSPEDATAVIINAILVNLSSSREVLRSRGYDLLSALQRSAKTDSFDTPRGVEGLFVPGAHLALLTVVSERLASTFPAFALGVMSQIASTVATIPAEDSSAYIHCLRPWLHHLQSLTFTPREERDAVHLKVRRALRHLMRASLREPAIHSALLSRVWPAIGKLDVLLPLFLDECIRLVTSFDVGSERCSKIGEMLVGLAAGQSLRGKILARLRQCIARTALKPVAALPSSSEWPELTALLRLDLPLFFDTRPHLYLPEIFHVIISLCGIGSLPVRRSVYALTINTIHALAKDPESDVDVLDRMLVILGSGEGRSLFGLPHDLFDSTSLQDWDVSTSGEKLVAVLVGVIESAAPSLDTANAWRARWTSLATAACFQHNPALQPRQFLVLSFLGAASIDGDLVFQILTTLRSAIRLSPSNDGQLAVVIIRTLVATLPGLSDENPFWSGLGWLAVAFLQIGKPSVSAAAIPLLATVLDNMHQAGYFSQRPLVDTFLDYRDSDGPESTANALDDASGVDTEINFSFALATLLVNPLRHAETTTATVSVLFQLLRYVRANVTSDSTADRVDLVEEDALPFFLLLLPVAARTGRLDELLEAAGLGSNGMHSGNFERYRHAASRLSLDRRDSGFLAFALVIALAQDVHDVQERLAVFALLEHLTFSHPEVAEIFYNPLGPVLKSAVVSTAGTDELEAAQAILQAQTLASNDDPPSAERILDQLNELGFPALAHVGIPQEESDLAEQLELSLLASQLLSNVLNNPR